MHEPTHNVPVGDTVDLRPRCKHGVPTSDYVCLDCKREKLAQLEHRVDPEKPSLSLLVKLGSIAVHVDEVLSPQRNTYDVHALRTLIADEEVQAWVKLMGPLLPLKRK